MCPITTMHIQWCNKLTDANMYAYIHSDLIIFEAFISVKEMLKQPKELDEEEDALWFVSATACD